jgi:hypothetical protein
MKSGHGYFICCASIGFVCMHVCEDHAADGFGMVGSGFFSA